ncbi:MAG: type II toxin-antitoxin system RelE/ParE family toxin [Exilibacterium sp.]
MTWTIDFYDGVEDAIVDMPPKIQARMLRLLELMEAHGANLGAPHTAPMGDGLFELRAKAKEGILYGTVSGRGFAQGILGFNSQTKRKEREDGNSAAR